MVRRILPVRSFIRMSDWGKGISRRAVGNETVDVGRRNPGKRPLPEYSVGQVTSGSGEQQHDRAVGAEVFFLISQIKATMNPQLYGGIGPVSRPEIHVVVYPFR